LGGLIPTPQMLQQQQGAPSAPAQSPQPPMQPQGPATQAQGNSTPVQGTPQQGQQQDPFAESEAYYRQQIASNTPAPSSGGPIRQLLQNFIGSMGQSMMTEAGLPTPYQKIQQANLGLQGIANARANVALHQAMAGQFQPVPLVGMDGKPILGPDGKVISLPANHAQTFYAGQAAAASRVQVQGMRGDTAETVQQLRNQSTQAIHPLQQVLGEAQQAYNSGDMETYRNKLTEASQLSGTATQSQRSDKLDMFHQSQQYNAWKTNQDNQTKLQVAQLSQSKAPAAIMHTAAFAQGGLSMLNDANAAMQRLEARGVLGNVASNKIEDWIFGKGLVDPTLPAQDKEDIGKLRAAATYTSSAAMRAHTGRSSREIYDDFKNTMGINQGPDAWKGAMQETENMLSQYSQGATNASIMALRGMSVPPAPQTPARKAPNAPVTSFKAWKAQSATR
jgi:hypothetical protein